MNAYKPAAANAFVFKRNDPAVKRQLLTAYLAARFAYTHIEGLFKEMEDRVRPQWRRVKEALQPINDFVERRVKTEWDEALYDECASVGELNEIAFQLSNEQRKQLIEFGKQLLKEN